MELYRKISIFGVVISLILIFYQSSIIFLPGSFGFSFISTLYHFGIFAILIVFLIYSTKFRKDEVSIAIAVCIIYAGLDELHQYFVLGRSCNFSDFMIDFFGVIFGLFFVVIWNWICERCYAPKKFYSCEN